MREDAPVQIGIPLEREKNPEQIGVPLGREETNCTDLTPHIAGLGRDLRLRVLAGAGPHTAGLGRTLRRQPPAWPSCDGHI